MSGNQTGSGGQAPLDTSGNQMTVIGDGNSNSTDSGSDTAAAGSGTSGGDSTSGQDGEGSGNQTDAGATAPVDASGNQVTVIGDGNTTERNVPEEGDTAGPGAPAEGTDGTPGSVSSPGVEGSGDGTAAAASSGAQAAPAAAILDVLPQTGASAGLLLWAILGLAMLLLGLGLVTGRRAGLVVRLRGQGVAQAL